MGLGTLLIRSRDGERKTGASSCIINRKSWRRTIEVVSVRTLVEGNVGVVAGDVNDVVDEETRLKRPWRDEFPENDELTLTHVDAGNDRRIDVPLLANLGLVKKAGDF